MRQISLLKRVEKLEGYSNARGGRFIVLCSAMPVQDEELHTMLRDEHGIVVSPEDQMIVFQTVASSDEPDIRPRPELMRCYPMKTIRKYPLG